MQQFDLHGKKVRDAEILFDRLLNEARLKRTLYEVKFITGSGPIQLRLKALAAEHGLHHYIPLANRGCLVVEFE